MSELIALKTSHREQLRDTDLVAMYDIMTRTLAALATSPDAAQNQRADTFVAGVVEAAMRCVTAGNRQKDDPSEMRQAAMAFECLRFCRYILTLKQ